MHLKLVGEAGEELLEYIRPLGISVDEDVVRLGIAVHDAGKILHPNEISGPGNSHEKAGQKLMLENGVQAEVARCCVSHAQFGESETSIEELLVALSDKLWKGKRDETLEELVTSRLAERLGVDRWSIADRLDQCFEQIASKGDQRLLRSRDKSQ